MNDTDLERAAQAEVAAERNRKQAEEAWRRAWWETTMALAEPERRPEITAALNLAETILGQSRDHLGARRETGRKLAGLEPLGISKLPPRLAIEYVKAGGSASEAIKTLQDAERRELSLRDFAAELGTQGVAWQREGEREPQAPPSYQSLPPAQRVQWARDLVREDPEARQAAIDTLAQDPQSEVDLTEARTAWNMKNRDGGSERVDNAYRQAYREVSREFAPETMLVEIAERVASLRHDYEDQRDRSPEEVIETLLRRRPHEVEHYRQMVSKAAEYMNRLAAAIENPTLRVVKEAR